jgi:hypothetical protein
MRSGWRITQWDCARQTFYAVARKHAKAGGNKQHKLGKNPFQLQRGHGIGVALDVYTQAAIGKRAEAAEQLEKSVFAS